MSAKPHKPVMLTEMLAALNPQAGEVYVDGTFGAGGYTRAILEAARCKVYAIDRDPDAHVFAKKLQEEFPDRFVFIVGTFSDMCALLEAKGIKQVNGIVLDIGVSSMQLDRAERGFSFRKEKNGPLDMRMSQEGISAADVVNNASETDLANIIYTYGEEHGSRRIARAIVHARTQQPIETTSQLSEIVASALGKSYTNIDPATRTFQALRIHVNNELGELERGLEAAETLLAPGGRLVVVTFHSLEDRIVKAFTHSRCGKIGGVSRHVPAELLSANTRSDLPAFFPGKPLKSKCSAAESKENPRARSAVLRSIIKREAA